MSPATQEVNFRQDAQQVLNDALRGSGRYRNLMSCFLCVFEFIFVFYKQPCREAVEGAAAAMASRRGRSVSCM